MSARTPTSGVAQRARPDPDAERIPHRWWIDALHVATLCVFAVAQPLYDLLGRNASFFVAHRASRADIIAFSIVAFVVPTAILLLARFLISLVSKSAAHVFYLATLAVLGALALGPPVVRAWGVHWIPATALGIAIGVVLVSLYRRWGGFRRFLSILGVSTLAFPLLFLFASPVRDIVVPRALPASGPVAAKSSSKTPVMIVLFDELATTSLIRPDGSINAKRFPNFAKLAKASTWYRDATTVGLRTDQAVPAILTGSRVPRRQVPSSFAYPQNLFTLMAPTHRLHVHESVTQLCPPELCRTATGEATTGLASLFADASVVYGHLVVPPDLAGRLLPPLGDRWAGFTRDEQSSAAGAKLGGGDPVKTWLRSALLAAKGQHEGRGFSSFLRGVRPGSRPQLSWVHVQVPHPPWRYLPSGQTYPAGDETPGYHDFTWGPDQYLADEVLQRSLLQTRFADRMTGELMTHLEQTHQWDDTMLVVLADHGATWQANNTRRDADGSQRASLLGVPLFIKYPHEERGRVDERNAETIDVLPTIADVAGIDVGFRTQGSSLLAKARRPAKRVFDGKRDRGVEYSFSDARRRSAEIEKLFGSGGGPDDLFGFGQDRDVIGRPLSWFSVDDRELRSTVRVSEVEAYEDVTLDGPFLPALLRGTGTRRLPADGSPIVVALNGTIAGVGRTFTDEGRRQISVMLSPRYFREGRNDIAVYALLNGRRLVRLSP